MEEDIDDPMEIDDSLPATSIIERNQDLPLVSLDSNTNQQNVLSAKDAADVVILDDDDEVENAKSKEVFSDEPPVKEIIDLIEKTHNSRCLNSSCNGSCSIFLPGHDFCMSYYRMKRSKSHNEEICLDCYNQCITDYNNLSTTLKNGGLVLSVDYPVINETLQIEDSDEEDEKDEKNEEFIDEENFKFISENIDKVLTMALWDLNGEEHYKKEIKFLKQEAKELEETTKKITKTVSKIRTNLDEIQLNLYNQFRPNLEALTGLEIIDDRSIWDETVMKPEELAKENKRKSTRTHKPVSYVELDEVNSNSPKALPKEAVPEILPPEDLPPVNPIEKPALKVGEIYYIVRENLQSAWIRARLQAIISPGIPLSSTQTFSAIQYKMIELKQQKERLVTGKNIAYLTSCSVRLPVGTRVISMFKETTTGEDKKSRNMPFYAGIVAEQPFEGNRYRYLIFFDIGYAQYVHYYSVHLVYTTSPNIWEDVYVDSRPFIRKYLESQDRPMVKLAKDQTVRVEYNGKWWLCTVKNVDCSLVQVFFDVLNRTEWIYRGSTRLSPMFREELAATNRHTGLRTSRKGPNESATVIQYTRNADFVQSTTHPEGTQASGVRAVARKSTTRPQGRQVTIETQENVKRFLPQVNTVPMDTTGPTSKIMYYTPRNQVITTRVYRTHICSLKCKDFLTHDVSKLRGHNPLAKPLLCGWARMTMKAKGRKEIIYKAPCGRLLRNIAEVQYYLKATYSDMTIDLFDFNHMVRCLAEFSVDCDPEPRDLSRGLEMVAIPVINGVNNEMLDFCNYSIKRVPMEGVNMNLDPDFLCGCDCEDDCMDKTKCACWKLTLEAAKYIGRETDPNSVGYIYRRLPEQVITGIYECNSRCKCKSTCLNRVVQNPMSLKLQVFRTHNRGWGIRCLNDVPKGSFICIYAGTLHTEQTANEDGMAYGDEYFAELDYIETVEKFKDDYEAEALEDEEDAKERVNSADEEDETETNLPWASRKSRGDYRDYEFVPSCAVAKGPNVTESESGIRTRLRKRNDEDKPEAEVKVKREVIEARSDVKAAIDSLSGDIETVTISDDEDEGREVLSFNPQANTSLDEKGPKHISVREIFGEDECVYIMDAKNAGNIGRFLNHSCSPNVFVQNVFVDTHDPRFPWVSFFSSQFIRAGTELTWNYNYDIGSVPNRVLYCYCASAECKGRLL